MVFSKPVVIIDNGRYTTKAGFSCDNHPVSIFRTMIGRPSYLKGKYGREPYEVLVGDEAAMKPNEYDVFTPKRDLRIVQWDNIERIWHHVFYRELRVAPEDRAVLYACSPLYTVEDKRRCCEVFFETLNTPSLCIQPTTVLAMYGSGTTTGIVIDLGHDSSEVCPVYEGGFLRYAHVNSGIAGSQISTFIQASLVQRDIEFDRHINTEIVEGIIKNFLYVTPNAAMPADKYQLRYKMPNGKKFLVRNEAFLAGELIFNPKLVNKGGDLKSASSARLNNPMPLTAAVIASMNKTDIELHPDFLKAIVVCGGLAAVPGLINRLQKELEDQVKHPINIIKSDEPYAVPWLGGAIFASLPDAPKVFLSKKQFEEQGEKIVRNLFI